DAAPSSLTSLGDTLVFVADDGRSSAHLWRSDGTPEGTLPLADLSDINGGTQPPYTGPLALLRGRLLFGAYDGVTGNELWSSDGTPAGTRLVKDIWPGRDGSMPGELTVVNDRLFFAADDGVHGRELWKSDGTAAHTVLVADLEPGPVGASPTQLTAAGRRVFFVTGSGYGTQLWVSDGTASGTVHLRDPRYAGYLTGVGDVLYFTSGTTLWKSDGTVDGTVVVADFHPVSGSYGPNRLTAVDGQLFFASKPYDGSDVYLWSLSGTHFEELGRL